MRTTDWGLVLTSVGLTVVANLLLRAGLDRAGGFPVRLADIPAGLLRLGAEPFFDLGMGLYVAAMLVWFRVLATQPLTTAYPIVMSLNFVLVTLAAVLLFRESLSAMKVIGLVVILAGIFVLSRG
jgi:multidrug transporter EmrE-like cation transporter